MKFSTKLKNGSTLVFTATKCGRPLFTSHRGRTWDILMTFVIDDNEVDTYIDTSWGRNYYVQIDGVWYRIPVYQKVTVDNVTQSDFEINLGYKCPVEIRGLTDTTG